MTTQREVVEAFGRFENSPRRASNFKMVCDESGSRAALVGAGKLIYAHREPLNQIVVFTDYIRHGWHYRIPINTYAARDQARLVAARLSESHYGSSMFVNSDQNVQIEERRGDNYDENVVPTVDDYEYIDS